MWEVVKLYWDLVVEQLLYYTMCKVCPNRFQTSHEPVRRMRTFKKSFQQTTVNSQSRYFCTFTSAFSSIGNQAQVV